MARYTGPKTKKARAFSENIFGPTQAPKKRKATPGQHGPNKRRKQSSNYAKQLMEKQKAKYTYGVLERQFRKTFEEATRRHGVTGEVLLQFLEARLDNTVYRLGISPTRNGARQLVSHCHVTVNGKVANIPSYRLRPGDIVAVRNSSQHLEIVGTGDQKAVRMYPWLEWNPDKQQGVFISYPERTNIPENINEQLIVELYSK
jgi:small subunit ribosomal protein S4